MGARESKSRYIIILCSETSDQSMKKVKKRLRALNQQIDKDNYCINKVPWAASNGHIEVVKFLVQAIADQSEKDQCCVRSLKSAEENGHSEVVNFLVQKIVDQDLKDKCAMKAAESAAAKGNIKSVKFLVENIFDQSVKNKCCMMAAESAAKSGNMEIVNFLAQTFVDQHKKDRCCRIAATSAAKNGEETFVAQLGLQPEWLLSFNSNILLNFLASLAIQGKTLILNNMLSLMQPAQVSQLLCLSISAGHISLAVTLLPNVSEVDLPDSSGATALMLTAAAGHHELIAQLLDLDASVRAEDSQGWTALSWACQAGHVRAAKTLADRGSDETHRDYQNRTCVQLAEQFGHMQIVWLFVAKSKRSNTPELHAKERFHINVPSLLFRHLKNKTLDEQLSLGLHHLLKLAGFTKRRAMCQQTMADLLQGIAQILTKDDLQMTGSYAEGWANSLVQMNGRVAFDSDIDWTVLIPGQTFHLEGGCDSRLNECKDSIPLRVTEGHAQVPVGSGSQPAVTTTACGAQPAHDTCHAFRCCSGYNENLVKELTAVYKIQFGNIHLVRATRPNSANELRLSFSFQEKELVRKLNTVQGQLFTLVKFIFKILLPQTLETLGLKTYHAKTLLFFMLEKHGASNGVAWQPQNLVTLLKESLDMILNSVNRLGSSDECMPHFFLPDAPLYFKNAGIGGDFDNTKARVRDRLIYLKSGIEEVAEEISKHLRPLHSENFYFHPFTLLPLTRPPVVTKIQANSRRQLVMQFADVYCVIEQCITKLQSETSDRNKLLRQLSQLQQLPWCKCAALCMTAMVHLKFGNTAEAAKLMKDLAGHCVSSGWRPEKVKVTSYIDPNWSRHLKSDWAWRFCFPCISKPHFPFLPEFTQTLFTARLSQPRSSHLYVNFRCLSWSLQAELLCNHAEAVSAWQRELEEDPDLEELLTLAHYSDCSEHLYFCLQYMETIRDERRIAMETRDEEKIEWVRNRLQQICNGEEILTENEARTSF